MSRETTPDPGRGLADPPSAVEITISADPDARPLRARLGHLGERLGHLRGRVVTRPRAIAGALVVLAATAVLVAAALVVGRGGARHDNPVRPSVQGIHGVDAAHDPQGVDSAYGFQPRCLAVLRAHPPGYVHADLTAIVRANRSNPCARWGGTVTAIFPRPHGVLRPALGAAQYACVADSLPRAVQLQLGVCQ